MQATLHTSYTGAFPTKITRVCGYARGRVGVRVLVGAAVGGGGCLSVWVSVWASASVRAWAGAGPWAGAWALVWVCFRAGVVVGAGVCVSICGRGSGHGRVWAWVGVWACSSKFYCFLEFLVFYCC